MAEEILVGRNLTPSMIEAGKELVTQIDRSGVHLTAAFWLYLNEAFSWRLVLAAPEVRVEGPRRIYNKVKAASRRMPPSVGQISIADISVTDDRTPFITSLRNAFHMHSGGMRITNSSFGSAHIEDAYIYRAR